MMRIGVFVCWCGSNIAKTVDVAAVAEAARDMPGVVYSTDYKYMCSEPGQNMVKDAIKEHRLDRVVIASCSPRLHEPTFQRCIADGGLNAYMVEMANLREHCSWVHEKTPETTEKAIHLVRMAVAKVTKNDPLQRNEIPLGRRALVIGGGIAGIQAALDIADAGYPVVLVERTPSIGGHMAQYDKTFPTLDCAACILTPKMVDCASHPLIDIWSYSEVEEVKGFVGNFEVKIRKRAKSIIDEKCTGCGECLEKCPVKGIPSEFDENMGTRRAIYRPFPQAVPNKPVIDRLNCRKFLEDKCGVCAKICPTGAIDYAQEDEVLTEKFGGIVVATGFGLWNHSVMGEYGYGKYPDVISAIQFERIMNASGPTDGHIVRPSDGKTPKAIAFLSCVGSRDQEHGHAYCSKVCCMYNAKQALLVRDKLHDVETYVFYMDIRANGKGYEEFVQRTIEDFGANYIRGRVSKIYPDNGQMVIKGADTLLGKAVEVRVDLVVLATAMQPQNDAKDLARMLGISTDQYNWFSEAHPKLKPVEVLTDGIYLAGACQYPKDIPDTVAQASAAASKVIGLFSKKAILSEPMIANINEDTCAGCGLCVNVCPYGAIELIEVMDKEKSTRENKVMKSVANVNEGVCKGCGTCAAACRSLSANLRGFEGKQILAEIDALADMVKGRK
ncbi:MAG: CoB--CoM heterodisulfide reductase iron-sulfur subunit A family protein [Armatimonadetes bacterium]|nr:CoB--CoM heterodisulfide reductase iron-sulfur subunit A family protein [Armatimonadota bacterium]